MRAHAAGVAILLLMPLACAAQTFCGARHTHELSAEGLAPALRRFFGNDHDALFWRGRLADQVLQGLGGPDEEIDPVQPGLYLAAACRAQHCDDKAAIVYRCPAEIEAVGVLHYSCATEPGPTCTAHPILTVYFSDRNPRGDGGAAIEEWALSWMNNHPLEIQHRSQSNRRLDARRAASAP